MRQTRAVFEYIYIYIYFKTVGFLLCKNYDIKMTNIRERKDLRMMNPFCNEILTNFDTFTEMEIIKYLLNHNF